MSDTSSKTAGGRFARIPIDAIRVYERNPRRTPNPEYDRIKQSIREQGLDQPIVVAERGEKFVVAAGGNTRLGIVKELFGETGDPRFAEVDCVVRPWDNDTSLLVAHLRENDLRGSLTFIDRARAVLELYRLIELQEARTLSQRQLAARLTRAGYAISQALISPMIYAAEFLEPLLPMALGTGLGRRPVERIRTLERAAGEVWREARLGTRSAFLETFKTLCGRSDAVDWSFDVLRASVELEIASASDLRIHAVRQALDEASRGSVYSDSAIYEGQSIETQPGTMTTSTVTGNSNQVVREQAPILSSTFESTVELEEINGQDEAEIASDLTVEPEELDHIGVLRLRAFTLARRLAQRYGLGHLVIETPDDGTGYAVIDVPDETLNTQLDPELLGRVSLIWWHLVACAELMVAPPTTVLPRLPVESILRRILETRDAELLFDHVWTTDPGQVGDLLYRGLPDADWQSFVDLMRTYRRLHVVASTQKHQLWRETSD